MRRKSTILLALCVAGLAAASAGAADAPAATAPRPVAEFAVADYAGQVVVVDFWASWCGPCRQALPWLNAMQEKYGAVGLQVVMVNLDKKEGAARKMEAEIAGGIAQFRDPAGKLAAEYELQGMPSTYIYDRQGNLVGSHVGFLKGDAAERETELKILLAKGGD